jgi:hypothetical protein
MAEYAVQHSHDLYAHFHAALTSWTSSARLRGRVSSVLRKLRTIFVLYYYHLYYIQNSSNNKQF